MSSLGYQAIIALISSDQTELTVTWNASRDAKLTTQISVGGRAMELSDLVVFNRKLLTVDDRTGFIFEIVNNTAVPWIFLNGGPGNQTKPLKGEWMTVKEEQLWVGGIGKELTTPRGVYINDHPMWVKMVDTFGPVQHFNWKDNYKRLRSAAGIHFPGYMVHESCVGFSCLADPRIDIADEQRGTNMLLSATKDFDDVNVIQIAKTIYEGTRGFSAFQFIPDTNNNLILAIKSEEINGTAQPSYVTAFDINGRVILPEVSMVGKFKFEGLSFI